MADACPAETGPAAPVPFGGRIIMVGCGCIGQAVLPILGRHIVDLRGRLTVLSADELGRGIAERAGARFVHAHLTPGNHRAVLARYVEDGDLLLNLSVDVSSRDLIRFCADRGALYVDTSIEPWPGVFDNPMRELLERTNFVARAEILELAREFGPEAPTAVVDHGANPGLVSHFVKHALIDLERSIRGQSSRPSTREEWARLAFELDVTSIQISERDTQASDRPKRDGEFVNTWSIDGFVDELMQPTEFSFGTSEKRQPPGGREHRPGSGTLFLERPGGGTFARSWVPSLGGFQGMLVTHDEVFSIADYLSIRQDGGFTYRPTVMFVYHPCDDAMLSALELEGRGWSLQPSRRRLGADIVTGMDELGVLLAGHERNAYWFGSQLTIEEARRHVGHANATSVQVMAGVIAAVRWAIRHPRKGVVEADDMDFEECLAAAAPYLGRLVGEFTDWTPLEGRGVFFPERLDVDTPWQLQNIRSRQWYED